MPVSKLTLTTFQQHTSTPDKLHQFYHTLHTKAASTQSIFISQTPLQTLLSRLSTLQSLDPHKTLPLHAVPYVTKDNIDAPPHPTTAACPTYSYHPSTPAHIITKLDNAGAINIGKVNMDQFASGLVGTRSPHGTPVNPHNNQYIPGGSSSASAVAVATAVAVFALGTDTAGSGRVPAAMNGLVGLKPTKGLVSTTGIVPAAASLDCVSIFANCVDDSADILHILIGSVPSDDIFFRLAPADKAVKQSKQLTLQPRSFRLGTADPAEMFFDGDHISQQSYNSAIETLREIGGSVVQIDFSPFHETAQLLYNSALVSERYAGVGEFIKQNREKRREDFDNTVAGIILAAEGHKGWQVYEAENKVRRNVQRAKREVWSRIDVLIVPTIPRPVTVKEVEADAIGVNSMLGRYTNFVNLMDYCAIAVPVGMPAGQAQGGDGVPRGVTLIAEAFEENLLLEVAKQFEAEMAKKGGGGSLL